jgi:hypothetical protein
VSEPRRPQLAIVSQWLKKVETISLGSINDKEETFFSTIKIIHSIFWLYCSTVLGWAFSPVLD